VWVPLGTVRVFQLTRVRRGRILRAQVRAVQPELHAHDPDVVAGIGGDRHHAPDRRVTMGLVIATVGAVVSPLLTMTVTLALVAVLPRRLARWPTDVCVPFATLVVSQEIE
jgi:hypothetical protein